MHIIIHANSLIMRAFCKKHPTSMIVRATNAEAWQLQQRSATVTTSDHKKKGKLYNWRYSLSKAMHYTCPTSLQTAKAQMHRHDNYSGGNALHMSNITANIKGTNAQAWQLQRWSVALTTSGHKQAGKLYNVLYWLPKPLHYTCPTSLQISERQMRRHDSCNGEA